MPRHRLARTWLAVLITVLALGLSACGGQGTDLRFVVPTELPRHVIVGVPFSFSFCQPTLTNINDLCDSGRGATNPVGGRSPYHFELGPGVGFPPTGLILVPNGILRGTPTATGTKTFQVCAVDLAASRSCQTTQLTVKSGLEGKWKIDYNFAYPHPGPFGQNCPAPWSGTWDATFQDDHGQLYGDVGGMTFRAPLNSTTVTWQRLVNWATTVTWTYQLELTPPDHVTGTVTGEPDTICGSVAGSFDGVRVAE